MTEAKKMKTPYGLFIAIKRMVYDQRRSEEVGRPIWTIRRGLSFYLGCRKHEHWVTVPDGFEYSGPVLPSCLARNFTPAHPGVRAAILHQHLRQSGQAVHFGVTVDVDKRQADEIFLEAMKVDGLNPVSRWFYFLCAKAYS